MHRAIAADLPVLVASAQPVLTCREVLEREPSGSGEQIWVRCRLDGLPVSQARSALARSVGVDPAQVASAGTRDRRAQVEQWFSLPAAEVEHPQGLRNAGTRGQFKVLTTTHDREPVSAERIAALAWEVRLPGAAAADGFGRARAILDRLRQRGCPDWFPPQRYGPQGVWLAQGLELLRGQRRRLPAEETGRALAAVQGHLFDRWVAGRLADGLFNQVLSGERVVVGCNQPPSRRSEEIVTDAAAMQRRMDVFEVVPLGPLFGAAMSAVDGEPALREEQVRVAAALPASAWERLRGARRPLRFQPVSVAVDIDRGDVAVACRLPTGSAVDALLGELGMLTPD